MIRVIASLLALLLTVACSDDRARLQGTDEIATPYVVSDLRIPEPIPGRQMGAAYFEFTNNSEQDLRITRVDSPELQSVQIHESVLENDVSRMVKLSEVIIPAGQSVRFEPGGKHLMLHYPDERPRKVSLRFITDDGPLLSVATVVTRD